MLRELFPPHEDHAYTGNSTHHKRDVPSILFTKKVSDLEYVYTFRFSRPFAITSTIRIPISIMSDSQHLLNSPGAGARVNPDVLARWGSQHVQHRRPNQTASYPVPGEDNSHYGINFYTCSSLFISSAICISSQFAF